MKTSEILNNGQSIQEQVELVLNQYGLNFEVKKTRLISEEGISTPYFGILNIQSGKVISVAKDSYKLTQNRDIVTQVLTVTQDFGDLRVSNGGSINGGCKTFLQLGIDGISRVGDDTIKKYITILDSNDGSTGLGIGVGNLTMSCQNQFMKFYKTTMSKIKHTANSERKMMELPLLIRTSLEESLRQIEIFNQFASKKISRELAEKLLITSLGFDKYDANELPTRSKNTLETAMSHLEKELAQKGLNVWGAFSGVTSFTTHEKQGYINDGDASSIIGTAYRRNQLAFDYALELA